MAALGDEDIATWRAFLNAHVAAVGGIEEDLRAAGLPPLGWYDVLWPLYRAPQRRLRMGELSRQVVLSRTGLTRLVDRVERAGLVRREPVPGDGRGAFAILTPAGARMLRRMWPVYERGVAARFAPHVRPHANVLRPALEAVARSAE